MRFLKSVMLGAMALGVSASSPAENPPPACATPEHRHSTSGSGMECPRRQGQARGHEQHQEEIGGCVLHERYDTGRGYSGESFNVYARRARHGTRLGRHFRFCSSSKGNPGREDGPEGQTTGSDLKITKHRITWTPNPEECPQLWESTARG